MTRKLTARHVATPPAVRRGDRMKALAEGKSGSVRAVARASKRKKKRSPSSSTTDPALALAAATRPLLELFSVVDDVFTEDDALSAEKRQMSLGRIYRGWKECRAALDPDFDD